ncbi:MAG: hypothetical protein JWM52_690 [Candidatus Saccharibacteria bacterium]|nr:hypothetical protein [Candidatus Saccharibacteria bacterium]
MAPGIVLPTLYVEVSAWAKILGYARQSGKQEINGFGYVRHDGFDFIVDTFEDIFITKQEVSGGAAEVSGDVFALAVDRAAQDARQDELRLQWHSHVDMDAYFSATDTSNIENYGNAGMEYFLSLVVNKQGKLSARLDVFQPIRVSTALQVLLFDDAISLENLQQDIDEHVTTRTVVRFAASPRASRKPRGSAAEQQSEPAAALVGS